MAARVVRIRIVDAQAQQSRKKPFGAIGATIFSYVGENPPPANDPAWKWEGQTGKNVTEVEFPDTVTSSTKVWLQAVWYTQRGDVSVPSAPLGTYLAVAGAQQAA